MTETGVGARLLRKEDDRYMRGRGQFVGDIKLAGMKDVAFVRSPVAHARVTGMEIPPEYADRVFRHQDMTGVQPIRANSSLPGFKHSEQTALVSAKVRHVGELIAICVADTRALAEDMASEIFVDFEELPVIADMLAGREPGAALLHEQWGDNIFLESVVDADLESVAATAPIKVTREFRTARQCMSPIEGLAVLAYWDSRLDQLVMYSATQVPHLLRNGLAECLGLDQARIRVISPDVGGGFGYKSILSPEELCLAWLAMNCDHPVRWLEDRREHLTSSANCREHYYKITGYADERGKLLAVDAEACVDTGAYSAYPFSAGLEAAQVVSIMPGPYDFPLYRCRTWSVATNKPPLIPYRGVARTGVCYALESLIDAIARKAGREPYEIRLENLVPPEAMPFDNITGKHFDSGDYPECLRRAVAEIDLSAVRERQVRGESDGRLIGVGMAIFCEQAAHGTSVYSSWGIPMTPGYEQAMARLTPTGELEIRVGIHSHGQGLETTLAQIASEVLGIDPARVDVVHGDTGSTPYSTGTWGSRCIVMAGGAVSKACQAIAERVAKIGAHLLQTTVDRVTVVDGNVVGPSGNVSLADIAGVWYLRPQELPADVDTGGLEVTAGFRPNPDTGTFSYACHAAVVAVDPELGAVEILDYAVVEDPGRMVNPMVVDGQVFGGVAQGIGTALYEEMLYDADGQPQAATLADYLLPGTMEVPDVRIVHMETPSPYTEFGVKGIGEGGAIAPPGAIANAVNDALRPLGVEINETPITPRRVLAAIAAANGAETRP
jgi:carbon-monoxide dehydrogenase large subunit